MMSSGKTRLFALLASLFVVFTLVSVDFAEARRGGSFGSRGTRTFQSAPPTRTAPNEVAPVQRTMTPNQNPAARQNQPFAQQQRPGLFNGMSGLMRGLVLGGLLGVLLGYGFGGMAGALGFILQLLLIFMLVTLAMRFFRSRQEPAAAGGPRPYAGHDFGRGDQREASSNGGGRAGSFTTPSFGGSAPQAAQSEDIELTQADLDTFERRLSEIQTAYGAEDFVALRRLCTPEMVSFFSEELAENAKRGVRNDVRNVHLVQADIAEAWREDGGDYASAAFRYESVDVMRDRNTGEVVEGDEQPTETVELWTFLRRAGDDWKLTAIQES